MYKITKCIWMRADSTAVVHPLAGANANNVAAAQNNGHPNEGANANNVAAAQNNGHPNEGADANNVAAAQNNGHPNEGADANNVAAAQNNGHPNEVAPEQRFPEQRLGTGAAISRAAIGHVSRRPSGAKV
jgi:hypothetical protein